MAHKKIIDSVKKQGQVAIKDLDEFLRFVINESDMRTYDDNYISIKVGDPGDWYEEFVGTPEEKDIRCGDCGAKIGYYHHYGCDIEKCPICGGQFLSCDCLENFDSAVLTI